LAGVLYVVATPIGNLRDISLRAVDVLSQVSLVLAEDTRRTKGLMSHLGLSCRVLSCYGHREEERISTVLGLLDRGESVALLSDAGTPTLSDPGSLLISKVWDAGFGVVPVPGPSAMLTALMASGLPPGPFTFWGFLPRKRGELVAFLQQYRDRPERSVFYEAPNRLVESLTLLLDLWGDRYGVVARELTKVHEELVRGPVSHILAHFSANPPRGEITLVVEGAAPRRDTESVDVEAMFKRLVDGGLSPRDAARALRILFAIPRDRVYKLAQRQEEG